MPPGTGAGFTVIVVVLGQPSPASVHEISYAPPALLSISLSGGTLPTQGGSLMTLACTNIGRDTLLVRVYVCPHFDHDSTCTALPNLAISSWDTTVQVPSPPIVAAQLLQRTQLYFVVFVCAPGGQNLCRQTNMSSVPVGQPLLLDAKKFSGDYVSDLVNSTQTQGGQLACVDLQLSRPGGSAGTPLAFIVTLVGVNLGSSLSLSAVSMNTTGGKPYSCELCYIADTVAMCLTTMPLVAEDVTVSVFTGAQWSPPVPGWGLAALVNAPSILCIRLFDPNYNGTYPSKCSGPTIVPATGGLLILCGTDFKNAGSGNFVSLSRGTVTRDCVVDASACYNGTCGWGSVRGDQHNSIAFCLVPPGGGANWEVDITVRALPGVNAPVFSYAAPTVQYVTPPGLLPASGCTITITGNNFGDPVSASAAAVVLKSAFTTWMSPCVIWFRDVTTIVCAAPNGTAPAVSLTVTVMGLDSAASKALNPPLGYREPAVTSVLPNHGGTTTGGVIVIAGTDFGLGPVTVNFNLPASNVPGILSFPVTQALTVLSANDTRIFAVVPAAWCDYGNGTIVQVWTKGGAQSNDGQRSDDAASPRYYVNAPVLHSVSTTGTPHIQNDPHTQTIKNPWTTIWRVILSGSNLYGVQSTDSWFIDTSFQPTVFIGGFACTPVTLASADSIECAGPSGVGAKYKYKYKYKIYL
jgi:hypothetical protein